MTALKRELDGLTDLMKEQQCYIKYQEALNKIRQDQTLYDKLNEFRRKNVELHYNKQTLKDEASLERQYHEFITEDVICEFLYWEQQTLKMLRMIHREINDALILDYSFLS